MAEPIVFIDLAQRAEDGRNQINPLPAPPATGEHDPFFKELRKKLFKMGVLPNETLNHKAGKFPTQQVAPVTGDYPDLTSQEKILAAMYGILERDNVTNPEVDRFGESVAKALGEFSKLQDLFIAVLPVLARAGQVQVTSAGQMELQKQIRADFWTAVVRTLFESGISANDPNLALMALGALEDLRNADGGLTPSTIEIDLPSLENHAEVEIIPDNLHAMQAIYFAAMLEELKVFQVVDKLVELFLNGMLPVVRGKAGNILYKYWKDSDERLTEMERRNLYARGFGFAGGDPGMYAPNREFDSLWLRFVSAVSSFVRQIQVDKLLRAGVPAAVSQEQMRKAGRDLAANLSLHGYGVAYFAATELQAQIKEIIELLGDTEIKLSYGARDMFQVVDQVATLELGGAKNSIRYRTMAGAGAIIIRWMANRAHVLTSSALVPVLNLGQSAPPRPGRVVFDRHNIAAVNQPALSAKPTVDPTDLDLINACEQWLAVTGTLDTSVEQYAQPSEPPMMTSRPIHIPDVARDLLESVGVSAGMSNGHGNGRYARR